MKLEVYNIKGEGLGREVELPTDIFGLELNEKHDHVVYLAVKQYNANQRQGTHKSKERAEIAGSTRKLKKQKGTGTARAGSIKSPVFRGGGRVFGPQPRTYGIKLNKKVKQLARKAVLTSKAQEGKIIVVEDFVLEAPKTKDYLTLLNSLNVETKSLLVLNAPVAPIAPIAPKKPGKLRGAKNKADKANIINTYQSNLAAYKTSVVEYSTVREAYETECDKNFDNIVLSSRNVKGAEVVNAKDLNVYRLMDSKYLILSESSLNTIKELLG